MTWYMSCPGDWYVVNSLLLSGSERLGLIAIVFLTSLFILSRFILFRLSHRPGCKGLIVVLMMEAILSLTVLSVCFCLVIACLGGVTFILHSYLVFVWYFLVACHIFLWWVCWCWQHYDDKGSCAILIGLVDFIFIYVLKKIKWNYICNFVIFFTIQSTKSITNMHFRSLHVF